MALFNRKKREINSKIVYFGPPLAGKATTLHFIHRKLKPDCRGPMKTIGSKVDRLLFFDFVPPELEQLNDYRIRFHLYTVQGEVTDPSTWKTVLKGADGVIFVADATTEALPHTRKSMDDLREYLRNYGVDLEGFPFVIQCNKSDLPNTLGPDELSRALGVEGLPAVKASSMTGEGVLQALTAVVKGIIRTLREQEPDRGEPKGVEASLDATSAMEPERPSPPMEVGEREDGIPFREGYAEKTQDHEPLLVLESSRVSATPDGILRIPLTVRCGDVEREFLLEMALSPRSPSV